MTIHEIENMSFAELKEKRAENLDVIKNAPREELESRYLQARTDSTQREEKLSEQGKTITSLNEGHELLSGKVAELQSRVASKDSAINKYVEELGSARQAHSDEVAVLNEQVAELKRSLQQQITELRDQLDSEKARAERLKAEATRNATALTTAEKTLKDAVSAQQIDDADTGE